LSASSMTHHTGATSRRVLVTGVSSGLGRALVHALLASGAAVVGVARRAALGGELEAEVDSANFRFVAADIAQVEGCRRAIEACTSAFGGIDVLINNAGARTTPPMVPLHELDEKNWDTVVDTNLKGPFFLTRYALPTMIEQGYGLIINVSSQTAEQATTGMAAYSSSKAGLLGLTRSIAVEYLDQGIRALSIVLGGTDTGQPERTMATERVAASTSTGDFRPMLYPADAVARTIALLTQDDAATITGASIAIDHATTAGALTSAYIQEVIRRAQP